MPLKSLSSVQALFLLLAIIVHCSDAWLARTEFVSLTARKAATGCTNPLKQNTLVQFSEDKEEIPKEGEVEIGTGRYFEGMVSRSVNEEEAERVAGDKLLGPTLKLAGGVTAVLVGLTLAFLISNSILSL